MLQCDYIIDTEINNSSTMELNKFWPLESTLWVKLLHYILMVDLENCV